ncbi:uncharacterized protein F4817DRAFT_311726 [Daldinia loculata]|uniref:uncharacterized protein n=1 Tax=Daldinia loculata TaxID=103429 RepID=UPI0020C312C3|nr:uncharacterized protein F4817DRAFT_311726 [Daldinia loculata]KAI1651468.1 hypothetical protein F4817DRAFT_311726 [Daldinia loculata]
MTSLQPDTASIWDRYIDDDISGIDLTIDLDDSELDNATADEINTYCAESFAYYFEYHDDKCDEDIWDDFKDFFTGWQARHFQKAHPSLQRLMIDYLLYHGVYSEKKTTSERLETIANAEKFTKFPSDKSTSLSERYPDSFISMTNPYYVDKLNKITAEILQIPWIPASRVPARPKTTSRPPWMQAIQPDEIDVEQSTVPEPILQAQPIPQSTMPEPILHVQPIPQAVPSRPDKPVTYTRPMRPRGITNHVKVYDDNEYKYEDERYDLRDGIPDKEIKIVKDLHYKTGIG